MKKIACLILAACMALAFCACGEGSKSPVTNNASGYSADSGDIALVNSACDKTAGAIGSAEALGYSLDLKFSNTVDEQTTVSRVSVSYEYVNGAQGKSFSHETEVKSGDSSSLVQIYSDAEKVYAARAGTTYILADNDATKSYVDGLTVTPEFFNASKRKVLDSVIVNTDGGGYGFVFEYALDEDDAELKEMFGSDAFEGIEITVTGLRVSGIIGSDGRITSETVTYSYTYPITVEVPSDEVDPLDPDASTKTETKTVSAQMVAEINLDYGVTSVSVPGGMNVPSQDGGEAEGPSEISVSDFEKLSEPAGEE